MATLPVTLEVLCAQKCPPTAAVGRKGIVKTIVCGGLVLGLLTHAAVRHYRDPVHHHPLATLVATVSLTVSTLVVLSLPLDVRAASAGEVAIDQLHVPISELGMAVDALHTVLLVLGLGAIPFAYFYMAEDDVLLLSCQSKRCRE